MIPNAINVSMLQHVPDNPQLIGKSPSFLAEMERLPLVAASDADVLISGETGTGKELCARAIHHLSPHSEKPFVPVNCGAIPVNLVENELFGHKTGAFTSASRSQPGLIHEANGGTLFLDEIANLLLPAQVKLLRFLQEKEYRPLGSTKTRHADVRVIAASSIDMEKAVREGAVRGDLYYRLNVIPIKLPPLRDRREDIPILARHFLAKYSAKYRNNAVTGFSPDVMEILVGYHWPGNVRELEHVVQRAVVLTRQVVIRPFGILLPRLEATHRQEPFKEAKAKVVMAFEQDYVTKLLLAYQGNITRAARAAQKDRRAFSQLIRKHEMDAQHFKRSGTPRNSHNPLLPAG